MYLLLIRLKFCVIIRVFLKYYKNHENSSSAPGCCQYNCMGGVNVAPSYAINLIGNLPQTNDSGFRTMSSSTGGSNVVAVGFTLPTGTDYALQNAVLRLSSYDSTDDFNVQIRNDGGTNPGSTVLANFNLPGSQGTGIFDYTFSSSTAFNFQQNTKYWLYVDISAGSGGEGSIEWRRSTPAITPSTLRRK